MSTQALINASSNADLLYPQGPTVINMLRHSLFTDSLDIKQNMFHNFTSPKFLAIFNWVFLFISELWQREILAKNNNFLFLCSLS